MIENKNRGRASDFARQDSRRRARIRRWILLLCLAVLVFFGIRTLHRMGQRREVSVVALPCLVDQNVTPFGHSALYYDGTSIHCLNESGGIRWSYAVGMGARFACSDTAIVVWSGTQLFVLDANGHPTYNENMSGEVQFARIGSRYCAAVVGDDTQPDLVVKTMDGTPVDEEYEAFSGMILLDVGFYGEQDQYMWTLAMDVYGTAINSVLNTFQVGKMNTGIADLGEFLAYKVLFENNQLRVFTTQQLYTYDYKAVRDMTASRLVYGWQYIDATVPERGNASILLAPNSQITGNLRLTELRVLSGSEDRRFTLPSDCVGAVLFDSRICAVSDDYLYLSTSDAAQFETFALSLPDGRQATTLLGITRGGYLLVGSGDQMFSVSVPH